MAVAGFLMERPPPRRPERRRLGPSAALSALLHVGLVVAIVLLARRRVEAPQWLPPPSVQMVFQGGAKGPNAVPNKAPRAAHRVASPPPLPSAPAAPAPLARVPPPAPAARPRGALPAPAVPPRVAPAPPAARMAPRASPPVPVLPAPSPPAAPAPAVPVSRPAPAATLPLPPLRPAPPPRPMPAPRAAAPPLRFPAPMRFSLGPTRPTVAPTRARPPGRSVDLSFAAHGAGATRLSINGLLDRDGVGPDWANAFRAWLDRHTYYPRDAGAFGEQGEVVVAFVVARDGRVSELQLVDSSGHPLLDTATLAMFRDATLPPLPPQDGARLPVRFTMRYVIVPP